ncbi:olfactory receptor 10AG1-like [Candoia aspera]|uniref:olfactory receptor 10AG1-like n=1 Tax=Candoia aspera TaxID=51853 RepID=UPI002FD7FF06
MSLMKKNETDVTEFIFLAFGEILHLQTFLFLIFLAIYILTLTANSVNILLVMTHQHLHTPMYYFLGNLSCLEILYSSAILPKMLAILWTGDMTISVKGCIAQLYFFSLLICSECYLLSVMSYDRFLAICKPLHYATLMNSKCCVQLAVSCWVNGVVFVSLYLMLVLEIHYCGLNEIDHFYCEAFPLINLSCSHSTILSFVTLALAFIFSFPPFLLTVISYVYIISAVLKIPSTIGRQKAFSTCSSHLIVVCIFYGAIIIVYLVPKMETMKVLNKIFSLLYTILPPIANPLIYSLRNKDVKEVLKKLLGKLWKTNSKSPGCAMYRSEW